MQRCPCMFQRGERMEVSLAALAFCLCSWRSLLCPCTDAPLPFRLLKRHFRHFSLDSHQAAVFPNCPQLSCESALCINMVGYGLSLCLFVWSRQPCCSIAVSLKLSHHKWVILFILPPFFLLIALTGCVLRQEE